MKVLIKKELTNPEMVDGIAQVLGPHYHIYKVDEDGNETFVKTVDKDIKEAAREAERLLDIDLLEVSYKEHGPDYFKSSIDPDWEAFINKIDANSNYRPAFLDYFPWPNPERAEKITEEGKKAMREINEMVKAIRDKYNIDIKPPYEEE